MEAYSSMGLVLALCVASIISLSFHHEVVVCVHAYISCRYDLM